MIRSLQCILCLGLMSPVMVMAGPQEQNQKRKDTQKTVSGPDQLTPSKPTGKSYKKGMKGTTKVDSSKTGQSRRLGNSGNLTSSGDKKQTGQSQKGDTSKPNPR
jgi:hypothetical protein